MTTSAARLGSVYVFNATPHDITKLVLNKKSVSFAKGKLAGIEQETGLIR